MANMTGYAGLYVCDFFMLHENLMILLERLSLSLSLCLSLSLSLCLSLLLPGFE